MDIHMSTHTHKHTSSHNLRTTIINRVALLMG